MKTKLSNALSPCNEGHCAFVDITYNAPSEDADAYCEVYWCRYCGKVEVYTAVGDTKQRIANLTPMVTKIARGTFDG